MRREAGSRDKPATPCLTFPFYVWGTYTGRVDYTGMEWSGNGIFFMIWDPEPQSWVVSVGGVEGHPQSWSPTLPPPVSVTWVVTSLSKPSFFYPHIRDHDYQFDREAARR
jgi:hypothetical protein